MRRLYARTLILASVLVSCSWLPAASGDRSPLALLEGVAARVPGLARAVAPSNDGFERANDATDPDSNGRIVSAGWRSTKERRFEDLGARLPDAADQTLEVGLSRFESMRVHVRLMNARPSEAQIDRGRVVYPDALNHADRIIVSTRDSLEELVVLRDADAPRELTWTLDLPDTLRLSAEQTDGRGFVVADARDRTVLRIPHLLAWDGEGRDVPLEISWNDVSRALRIRLPSAPLSWPVVVDPSFETSAWLETGNAPAARHGAAMTFDVARGRVLLFGGSVAGSVGGLLTNETWVWDGTLWNRVQPKGAPPSRMSAGIAYDAARAEVVLFGGLGGPGVLNDTWTFDGTDWKQHAVAAPSARSYPALAFDGARAETILFGGGSLPDTWAWNGTSWTQRTPASHPSARDQHALAFDAARNRIVLFGGSTAAGRVDDTWTWDGAEWRLETPSVRPQARSAHGLVFDSTASRTILTTGYSATGSLGDVWAWNGTTRSQQPITGAQPAARGLAGVAYDPVHSKLILSGGFIATGRANDTWTLASGSLQWDQRQPTAPPSPRSPTPLVYDAARGEILLFGGSTLTATLDDTWIWDGGQWRRRTPAISPPARDRHALAYDAARGEVVLFGGDGVGVTFNDTWVWNGTTWMAKTTTVRPAPRTRHAMTYDSARREVLLFGGFDPLLYGDTWTWDGTSWRARAPSVSPSARMDAALAFDAVRQQAVLFGGFELQGHAGDTWLWDGSTWKDARAQGPRARGRAALSFDPDLGHTLLFGGFTPPLDAAVNDTWSWDGSRWLLRATAAAPPARGEHGLAYDAIRKRHVLFGGLGVGLINDAWVHVTAGGSCTTDADCIQAFCNDGVCCGERTCGPCATCAGTSPGRCAPVTNAEDPDSCALRDGTSCSALAECKAALGVAATSAPSCASGFVVDGVCCAQSACGPCETCDAAKKERNEFPGRCSAAKTGTDPHDDCSQDAPATCKRTGQCDGDRSCQLHPRGTVCDEAARRYCSGAGECTAEGASCDGDHTVIAPNGTTTDCGVYRCEGAACKTSCTSKLDCANNADCTPERVCEAFAARPVDDAGGCALTRQRAASPRPFLALIGLAATRYLVRRRRR